MAEGRKRIARDTLAAPIPLDIKQIAIYPATRVGFGPLSKERERA
jgi:hypothetical protein